MSEEIEEGTQPQIGSTERLLVGLVVVLGLPAVAVGLYLGLGNLPAEELQRRPPAEVKPELPVAQRWGFESNFTTDSYRSSVPAVRAQWQDDSNVTTGGGGPHVAWPSVRRSDSNITAGHMSGPWAEAPFAAPPWTPPGQRPAASVDATSGPSLSRHVDARRLTAAERRAIELAARLRQSREAAEQQRLREQMIETLHAAFDERREQQVEAIDHLDQQLQAMRRLDTHRSERRDEIVQRRFRELIGEPDPLAWEPSPALIDPSRTPPSARAAIRDADTQGLSAPMRWRSSAIAIAQGPATTDSPPQGQTPFRTGSESKDAVTSMSPSPVRLPAAVQQRVSFDVALRILELVAETAQLEVKTAQLESQIEKAERTSRLDSDQAELAREPLRSKQQLARAKLDVAEIAWRSTGQTLCSEVKLAELKLNDTRRRLHHAQQEHRSGTLPISQLHLAEAEAKRSEANRQAAKEHLKAWQEIDAILRKQREISATDALSSEASAIAENAAGDRDARRVSDGGIPHHESAAQPDAGEEARSDAD